MLASASLGAGEGERADAGSNHRPTYSSVAAALKHAHPRAYCLIGSKGSQTLSDSANLNQRRVNHFQQHLFDF